MDLLLNPKVTCTLEFNGHKITLTAAELAALRSALPDSGQAAHRSLPHAQLKPLFEQGFLEVMGAGALHDSREWVERLAAAELSPYLQVNLSFTSDAIPLSGDDPLVGLFHEPSLSVLAHGIARAVRDAVSRAVHACAVTGIVFPRDRGAALAQAAAAQWLGSSEARGLPITWAMRDGSLTLEVAPDAATPSRQPRAGWQAVVAVQHGASSRQVVVPVDSLPRIGQLFETLTRAGERDLASACDSLHVRRVLGALDEVGVFVAGTQRPATFVSQCQDQDALAVTHLGHAHVIVDGGGQRVLVDPWLFAWGEHNGRQPLTAAQLGDVAAICFTHHHSDHLEPGCLLTIPHHIPVFVPATTGHAFEPRIADFLGVLGFTDVRELAHGQSVSLGGGIEIEAIPFFGEGRDLLGFGANCYVISRASRNVLVYADAAPETSGPSLVSSGALTEVVARKGAMDVVFGTWWQERTDRYRLSNYAVLSPDIAPPTWLQSNEMCDCPPAYVAQLMRSAGAKLLVTYAESGAEMFHPASDRSSYIPSVSFLWESWQQVRDTVRADAGAETIAAEPYLTVTVPLSGAPRVTPPR